MLALKQLKKPLVDDYQGFLCVMIQTELTRLQSSYRIDKFCSLFVFKSLVILK